MSRARRITTVVLGTLLGLWFLLAGAQKFMAAEVFRDMFEQLGLPLALVPVVGVLEIIAGLLALVPKTSLYGAGVVVVVMLGAIGSHLVAGLDFPVPALVALVMAGSVAALRLKAVRGEAG